MILRSGPVPLPGDHILKKRTGHRDTKYVEWKGYGEEEMRGPGAEPLVGGQEAKPLEAERVLAVGRPVEAAIKFPSFYAFLNCKLQAVVYKKNCKL